jgi:hypothetical protein
MNLKAQMTIENFAYGATSGTSADTLTNPARGGNVWRRHSGTGGPIAYKSTSLSFPGYFSNNIGGSLGFSFASTSREDANRSTIPFNSGNVYVSFLLNMSSNGGATADYFFHLLDTSFITSFRGRHYIKAGSVANTFNIGINKGSSATPVYSPINYPLDTTLLVIVKYSFNASFLDTIYSYVIPFGTTIPAVEPSTATMVSADISTLDMAVLNSVAIRQGSTGTMAGTIDGIRVSNSWANSALPVNLTSFEGQITEHQTTLLTWTTASEINNKGFEIESSQDGINFETIGFVVGVGNSKTTQKYRFEHNSNANAFYRLNQIDFDGKSTYSQIVSIKNTITETNLTPNPFNDYIEITTNATITRAEVVDIQGKVVLSENLQSNVAKLDAKELLNGIYFIKIFQGDAVITKRIIKTN